MNNGHKRRGWKHAGNGWRVTVDSDGRRIEAWRDGSVWRLIVSGDQCGKSKAFRHIARWVRNRTYLYCL